jgi:hypothetical protein
MPSLTNYLHITERGDLEKCTSTDLCSNILNGTLLFPGFLCQDPIFIERTIAGLIHSSHISYLIISADPFCLPEAHSQLLASIPLPKGLILCDSHHGSRPLSRSISFCISAKIQSVLLRFNQRHAELFRLNGIWCDTTIFSPDLYQIALSKITQYWPKNSTCTLKANPQSLSQCDSQSLQRSGLFVGSLARIHPFRAHQIGLLKASRISFDVKTTPSVTSMINALSSYPWGLNLPLNGDFNRRFIEILLADIPVLSEPIPSSQCQFPFSRIFKHITTFEYRDGLNTIALPSTARANDAQAVQRSPLRTILALAKSSYDHFVLKAFDRSLRADAGNKINQNPRKYLSELALYDECITRNINPFTLCRVDAASLLRDAQSIQAPLGINVSDEFYRLHCYAESS